MSCSASYMREKSENCSMTQVRSKRHIYWKNNPQNSELFPACCFSFASDKRLPFIFKGMQMFSNRVLKSRRHFPLYITTQTQVHKLRQTFPCYVAHEGEILLHCRIVLMLDHCRHTPCQWIKSAETSERHNALHLFVHECEQECLDMRNASDSHSFLFFIGNNE